MRALHLALLFCFCACSSPPTQIARDRHGAIEAAAIDAGPVVFVAAVAPRRRAEQVAIERSLIVDAELLGRDLAPEMELQRRLIRNRVLAERALLAAGIEQSSIDSGEVAVERGRQRDRFETAERRLVLRLFDASDPDPLRAAADRLVAGRSVNSLLRNFAGATLGWTTRGQSGALDDQIFALEVDQSAILGDQSGHHLVHLVAIEEAWSAPQARSEEILAEELRQERRRLAVRHLAEPLAAQRGLAWPGQIELAELIGRRPAQENLLEIDDFRLTVEEMRTLRRLDRKRLAPVTADPKSMQRRFDLIFGDALLAAAAATTRIEIDLSADPGWRRLMAERALELELRRLVAEDSNRLYRHYLDNLERFSRPPRLELERVTIPARRQSDFEELELDLELDLETIAERLGGDIETLGWRSARQIATLEREHQPELLALEVGERSRALRRGGQLRIYRLRGRQQPQVRSFVFVLDAVVDDFLTAHRATLEERWLVGRLAELDFVWLGDQFSG